VLIGMTTRKAARRRRDRQLGAEAERQARQVLTALASARSEVLPGESLRARGERLLAVRSLRAADAFQLAAALLWARADTVRHTIVSSDDRRREAARREGFLILPE
jgi:hypothetical protein